MFTVEIRCGKEILCEENALGILVRIQDCGLHMYHCRATAGVRTANDKSHS